MINITLAVEDALSERVVLRTLAQVRGDIAVHTRLGFKGNTYLRKIARGLNKASKGSGFLLLTDQDDPAACPLDIINEWLAGDARHPNFLFRVAVLEVEAWLMADREAIADFIGVPIVRVPQDCDAVANPKQCLVNLARLSKRASVRDDLVPIAGGTALVGRNYSGRLAEFIEEKWSCKRASAHSASLKRTIRRLEHFSVQQIGV
jgi:hypothetical protein